MPLVLAAIALWLIPLWGCRARLGRVWREVREGRTGRITPPRSRKPANAAEEAEELMVVHAPRGWVRLTDTVGSSRSAASH